jgi:hypothetical protein
VTNRKWHRQTGTTAERQDGTERGRGRTHRGGRVAVVANRDELVAVVRARDHPAVGRHIAAAFRAQTRRRRRRWRGQRESARQAGRAPRSESTRWRSPPFPDPPTGARALSRCCRCCLLSSPSPLLTYAPEWSRLPSYLPTGYRPSPGRSQSQPSDSMIKACGPSDEERWERGRPRRGAVHRLDAALTSLTVGPGDRLWPVDVSARLLIRGGPKCPPTCRSFPSHRACPFLAGFVYFLSWEWGENGENAMCTMRVAC